MASIVERLATIRKGIDAALARSADPDRRVTIVAVTKGHPAAVVDEVARAGLLEIGENRVQEILSKAPDVLSPVNWHMIGHLQRNASPPAARPWWAGGRPWC